MKKTGKCCHWYPVCPMKRFYEKGLLEKKWVAEYCWISNPDCVRKKLEEQGKYHPDDMLPDGTYMEDPGLK
ncbi:MAG: hypothetical protein JW969_02790 [Spirochaetales bacterium]|nr:hypothetical protein [Spirochaetales bacterium]